MLSVSPIARVVVNTIHASTSPDDFNTGLLLIRDANYADSRRLEAVDSSAAAVAMMSGWGFTSSDEAYKSAIKYFGASPSPSRLLLSCYPSTETLAEALAAVLERSAAFYGVMAAQEETDERILELNTFISGAEHPMVQFVPIIGTPSAVVAAGSRLDLLFAAGAKRAFPFYCASVSDAAAVMGTAMGLELSHPTSAFSICYKTISGVLPSSLTEGEATAIKALNGNVYLARGYTHLLLEKGSLASGARYDELLYVDEIASDLQNAAVNLLADNPDKMPQTDDSTAQFINRFTAILADYAARNVLASGVWRGASVGQIQTGDIIENGFSLWADSYDLQSDVDRAAHKAMPVNVALMLAGSIESIVITVNVMA